VALITVDSGFQIHPVIATRWAGNLGRKSQKLIMVMVSPLRVLSDCSAQTMATTRTLPAYHFLADWLRRFEDCPKRKDVS
jgi:hypothetical protein